MDLVCGFDSTLAGEVNNYNADMHELQEDHEERTQSRCLGFKNSSVRFGHQATGTTFVQYLKRGHAA